nr:zinc-ribbon domain-containing protein [Deltaproteobacteria bacterium]
MTFIGKSTLIYNCGSGSFYCPSCEKEQQYQHKKERCFFCLFFLPLFPLQVKNEYVICQKCSEKFKTKVLTFNPQTVKADFQQDFRETLIKIMIAVMISDGDVDDNEVVMIKTTYKKLTGHKVKNSKIWQMVSSTEIYGQKLMEKLEKMSSYLIETGKLMAIRAASLVAAADGEIQTSEKKLIYNLGESLNLPH